MCSVVTPPSLHGWVATGALFHFQAITHQLMQEPMKKSAAAYLLKLAPAACMGISCTRASELQGAQVHWVVLSRFEHVAAAVMDDIFLQGHQLEDPCSYAITFSSRMVKGKVVATLSCAAMIFPRLGETCFVNASPAAQQHCFSLRTSYSCSSCLTRPQQPSWRPDPFSASHLSCSSDLLQQPSAGRLQMLTLEQRSQRAALAICARGPC